MQATNIILDPGLAFGTGEHPTTKLCLLFLHKIIKGGEHVLDYGTGSGILGIAALKVLFFTYILLFFVSIHQTSWSKIDGFSGSGPIQCSSTHSHLTAKTLPRWWGPLLSQFFYFLWFIWVCMVELKVNEDYSYLNFGQIHSKLWKTLFCVIMFLTSVVSAWATAKGFKKCLVSDWLVQNIICMITI